LERRPIPVLKSAYGRAGEIIFAHPYQDEKIIRTIRDTGIYLEIEVTNVKKKIIVDIFADFPDEQQKVKWKNYPMDELSPGRFKLDYKFSKCGLFEFKIKYSFDNGKTWFWDAGPVRKVLVDPPTMKSLRIYTLIPTISGTISDWKKMLPGIRESGFNAVHLLPVTRMGSSESPYSAVNLFELDPSFLDPDDNNDGITQFEGFVEEAKKLGIKLFLDIVVNHISNESNLANDCSDWIVKDSNEKDGLKRAGCTHNNSWIKWEDLVLVNYAHNDPGISYEIWNYMYHYVDFWGNYADYTGGGLRFDNLHSSNSMFMIYITGKLKIDYPDLILIGEYFSSKENFYKNVPDWQLNLILGNPWEYRAAPDLRRYLRNIHTQGGLKYFLPLTTHDTGSPAEEYGSVCSTMARYVIYALMGTGQTGIVQGSETGIEKKIHFIGRNNKAVKSGNNDFREMFRIVNNILEEESVFQEIGNINFIDNNHSSIIGVVRSDIAGKSAWLLLVNLDIYKGATIVMNQKDFRLPFRWFKLVNVLNGREMNITDMVFDISLDQCEAKIFRIKE